MTPARRKSVMTRMMMMCDRQNQRRGKSDNGLTLMEAMSGQPFASTEKLNTLEGRLLRSARSAGTGSMLIAVT